MEGRNRQVHIFHIVAMTILLMVGISLPVVAATSGSVGMSVTVDMGPPASITDLVATPGAQLGDIDLAWTTPGDDGTVGQLTDYPYMVKYDTRSVAELGGTTTTWWEQAAYTYPAGGWAALAPGVWDDTHWLAGLTPGTTYYIAIRATDDAGNEALNNNVACAMPREDITPPAAVTDLFAESGSGEGEIDLVWTEVGDDGTTGNITGGSYGVKYSTDSAFDWDGASGFDVEWSTDTILGRTQTATIGSLTPGSTYYFRIWTRDEAFNWSEGLSNGATTWAQVVSLAPEPPTGLVAKAGNRKVTLTWTPNTEPDMKSYWVYRSTTSGSYNVALATVTHPTTEYEDGGLTNDIIYYYVLKAVDEAGLESDASYEVWARPSLPPREPCGVKGTLVDGGKYIKIGWKAVTRNEDGSPYTDLEGYRIYRSSSLAGFGVEPPATVAQSVLTWNETENIIGRTYYYKVRAVDIGGFESADSMIIMVQDGRVNVIALAEDMQAKLLIPEELTDILYKESSSYGDDLNIKVEKVEEEENKDKVISCYEYKAFKGYGNETPEKIKSFSFYKPKASVSLSYEVSSEGLVKGTSIKASQAGKELALFWFNGIEWVKIGARTDTAGQVLMIRTKKLGMYKIKESFAATEFTLNKVYPRIFTPNNDGLNDVVNFEYANPNEKGVVCRIFDIRGALVRQLDIGQTETSFAWDGRDEKGKVALSGVYVYQLEGEGKVINGTVILAK